jgi:DMSO reductase anchor subunit
MIFGMTAFGTTWIIISIILGVIFLFLLGIFYEDGIDDEGFIALKAAAAIVVAIFWPFAILIAVCIGVVAIPIYLCRKIRNFIAERKEKKIEKENFFKQLEESKKKGG